MSEIIPKLFNDRIRNFVQDTHKTEDVLRGVFTELVDVSAIAWTQDFSREGEFRVSDVRYLLRDCGAAQYGSNSDGFLSYSEIEAYGENQTYEIENYDVFQAFMTNKEKYKEYVFSIIDAPSGVMMHLFDGCNEVQLWRNGVVKLNEIERNAYYGHV